jgi:fructose-specific phosphotransferase system IIA component
MKQTSELAETIREDLILLDIRARDKYEAFRQMVDLLAARGLLTEPEAFLKEVVEREEAQSTGIGRGVAFPHGRTRYLKEPVIVIARLSQPMPYVSIDTEPVRLLFLFGTPEKEVELYLRLMAQLCALLRQESIRRELLEAKAPWEIKQILLAGNREL